MNKRITSLLFLLTAVVCMSTGCRKTSSEFNGNEEESYEAPAVYKRIYGASSITNDGSFLTIKTTGIPDHKSAYFTPTDSLYEPYSGLTFRGLTFLKNGNTIAGKTYTFRIPVNPKVSTTHPAAPSGPIGFALNGVPFYNDTEGSGQTLNNAQLASLDKYAGHPDSKGAYHYHVEPLFLTTVTGDKSSLIGFLLDGFPVYGPEEENGTVVTDSKLDVYHGHTHATAEFPGGIYHYHINGTAPYLVGNGFYGSPGTVMH